MEEPLGIEILTGRNEDDDSTTGLNGEYIHSQQFLNVIQRMKRRSTDSTEFRTLFTEEYDSNMIQLNNLNEYETRYKPERALWWYSRDFFLYRMVNKALRAQNVNVLVLLRSFIRDVHRELKRRQCRSPIRVFRGQRMSTGELDVLQHAIGELISTKSFLSTSIHEYTARDFLGSGTPKNGLYSVLFMIDADPGTIGDDSTKPFADISSQSNFPSEGEVLFTPGSIFRLTNIDCETNGIRIVRMTLCDDRDSDVRHLLEDMTIHRKKTDFRALGDALKDMGKFDLAEVYLRRSLDELLPDDPSITFLYISLVEISEGRNDTATNIHWLEKSIELCQRIQSLDSLRQGQTQNLIGEVHRLKGDYDQALEAYNKALSIFGEANPMNHGSIAIIYDNICRVYQAQNKYEEALRFAEQSLDLRQTYFPQYHRELRKSYYLRGIVHLRLCYYDLALENFEHCLKIKQKSLPPRHPEIGTIYQNIGLVYEGKNEFQQALTYLNKALDTYRFELSSHHPDVVKCTEDISRVRAKLKQRFSV